MGVSLWGGLAAAAAAKLLQSCPTLCDPIDGSPLGSSVPGILQARILECVSISSGTTICLVTPIRNTGTPYFPSLPHLSCVIKSYCYHEPVLLLHFTYLWCILSIRGYLFFSPPYLPRVGGHLLPWLSCLRYKFKLIFCLRYNFSFHSN